MSNASDQRYKTFSGNSILLHVYSKIQMKFTATKTLYILPLIFRMLGEIHHLRDIAMGKASTAEPSPRAADGANSCAVGQTRLRSTEISRSAKARTVTVQRTRAQAGAGIR